MRSLYILGGTISYRHEGGWQLDYNDQESDQGLTGNVFRMVGAYYAWAFNLYDKLVFVGAKGFFEGTNSPTIAQTMMADMHRLGVPYDDMDVIMKGNDTLSQLEAVKDAGGDTLMSSVWHLPRIEILCKLNGITLSLKAAEDIITMLAPHWKPLIDQYNTKLDTRLNGELRGIYACLCGNYSKARIDSTTREGTPVNSGATNVTESCNASPSISG